jgi:hypothetical protein
LARPHIHCNKFKVGGQPDSAGKEKVRSRGQILKKEINSQSKAQEQQIGLKITLAITKQEIL